MTRSERDTGRRYGNQVRLLRLGLALLSLVGLAVFAITAVVHHADSTPAARAQRATITPTASSPTPAIVKTSECTTPGRDSYRKVADPSAPGGVREIWIHRPAIADSARIPVLYLLGDAEWSDRDPLWAALGRMLDREMCRTGVPFVVAVPDGRTVGVAQPEWGDATSGRFALEHFVISTAVRAVEGQQRRRAGLRAIGGFGMGGFGATAIALRNPSVYTQVASFGGWYRNDDPDGVFAGQPDAHAPEELITSPSVVHQRYFLVEGLGDQAPLQYGTVHGEADRFAALIRQRGLGVDVRHPAGGHDLHTWETEIPGMVRFLDRDWPAPGGAVIR